MYFWILILVFGLPFLQKYLGELLSELGAQYGSYAIGGVGQALLVSDLWADILFSLPFWLVVIFFIRRYGAVDDEGAFWGGNQ